MGAKPRREPVTVGLADAWREWILEAIRGGASAHEILDELVARGVARELAAQEIDIIASSTRALRSEAARLALLVRLLGELEGTELEVLSDCESDEFYARYYRSNRPVVLTDPWKGRAPLQAWSLPALRERHGAAVVDVTRGRSNRAEAIVDPRPFSESLPLADVIDAALSGTDDDLYIVSRNLALEGPLTALASELADLPAPLEMPVHRRVSLWLGPAATFTPFHHDTTNVFFCQMAGRKRIRLISSRDVSFLGGPIDSTFYSQTDPSEAANVYEVELDPGQALFIPVGWWHEVEALTPSVSLSFTNLSLPNRFSWYRIGRA